MDQYTEVHRNPNGPGDSRPTALQIIQNEGLLDKLSGKVILVTGCSSGIGVETVRALAATGAKVYGTARDLDKAWVALGEDVLKTGRVEILQLDLGSLASVRACAADFLSRSKHQLNILVNNAGVMATPEGRTTDGFETQFGTNHLGHFLLFRLLQPALLASPMPDFQSRVVILSSTGHRLGHVHLDDLALERDGYAPWKAYGQSKAANIHMANEIERRYGSQGIHALSLHPGSISTGLQKHVDPEFMTRMNRDPDRLRIMKSTEQGAATTVWAAVGGVWEGKGGKYLEDCQVSKPVAEGYRGFDPGYAPHIYDPELETRLWEVSEELVGI